MEFQDSVFRGRGFLSYFILTTQVHSGITVDHSIICNYGESAASGYKDWSGSSLLYILHSILYMDDEGIFRYDTNLPLKKQQEWTEQEDSNFCNVVILPLAVPGLVATGIFSFINGWNEYLFASTFMKSYEN